MRAHSLLRSGVVSAVLVLGSPAMASETTTYAYDALGRLVATTRSGGPSNGVNMSTGFDPAGNRTTYAITTPTPPPAPTFEVSNAASVVEGNGMTFYVYKTGATTNSYTVNYASASGTATSGTDFTATSGTLNFLPSEASKTITLATVDDTTTESSETALMNISAVSGGATITAAQGYGVITDNDTVGGCSFAAQDVEGTDEFSIYPWIQRTGTCAGTVTINYATDNGSAISGGHCLAASGTLTFTPSDAYQSFRLTCFYGSLPIGGVAYLNVSYSIASGSGVIADSQGEVEIMSSR